MVGSQCPAEFGGGETGVVVLNNAEIGLPLYLRGVDGVRLELGDRALVLARSASDSLGLAARSGSARASEWPRAADPSGQLGPAGCKH